MKEKIKSDWKIKKFDFQLFMEEFQIDKSKLDEQLVRMIEIFENHIAETTKHCSGAACYEISGQFQEFADFIMDELWEHVQENGLPEGDVVEEEIKTEEETEPTEHDIQMAYFEENYEAGKRIIKAEVLEELGLEEIQLNSRHFEIGHFIFTRRLMSDNWHVFKKSKATPGKELEQKEED